ncbi:MAG: hemerythrin domain-containing protein [Hydrogenophaga sp.]|nr:hemerythrin domain-containing protein [Hydrogenophaga sp.]
MATRPSSRAATAARSTILGALVDDHKRVKKAFRDFKKLDTEEDTEAAQALVQQVLTELQIHAALEEELLYPAAREALKDTDMLDEAEVEHESAHTLIDQLSVMSPADDKYFARFTVLCEYVLHHVKEEEGEMFPALESAKLDWESLAQQVESRREELMAVHAPMEEGESSAEDEEDDEAEMDVAPAAPARKRAASKSTSKSR